MSLYKISCLDKPYRLYNCSTEAKLTPHCNAPAPPPLVLAALFHSPPLPPPPPQPRNLQPGIMRPLSLPLPLLLLIFLSNLTEGAFTAMSTNWKGVPEGQTEYGENEGAAVDTYSGDTLTTIETDTSNLPFTVDATHAVKAFDYLGPDLSHAHGYLPYNSTLHSAPLQLLSLSPTMCKELLSGIITSQTFYNATVLVIESGILAICHFSPLYENPTSLYWALVDAGCSAIILVTNNNVPGDMSKLGAASYEDSSRR